MFSFFIDPDKLISGSNYQKAKALIKMQNRPHPHYTPSPEFLQRHGLHIDEAETWVDFNDTEYWAVATKWITCNKETGETRLIKREMRSADRFTDASKVLFIGCLPDEAALESVIKWTNW